MQTPFPELRLAAPALRPACLAAHRPCRPHPPPLPRAGKARRHAVTFGGGAATLSAAERPQRKARLRKLKGAGNDEEERGAGTPDGSAAGSSPEDASLAQAVGAKLRRTALECGGVPASSAQPAHTAHPLPAHADDPSLLRGMPGAVANGGGFGGTALPTPPGSGTLLHRHYGRTAALHGPPLHVAPAPLPPPGGCALPPGWPAQQRLAAQQQHAAGQAYGAALDAGDLELAELDAADLDLLLALEPEELADALLMGEHACGSCLGLRVPPLAGAAGLVAGGAGWRLAGLLDGQGWARVRGNGCLSPHAGCAAAHTRTLAFPAPCLHAGITPQCSVPAQPSSSGDAAPTRLCSPSQQHHHSPAPLQGYTSSVVLSTGSGGSGDSAYGRSDQLLAGMPAGSTHAASGAASPSQLGGKGSGSARTPPLYTAASVHAPQQLAAVQPRALHARSPPQVGARRGGGGGADVRACVRSAKQAGVTLKGAGGGWKRAKACQLSVLAPLHCPASRIPLAGGGAAGGAGALDAQGVPGGLVTQGGGAHLYFWVGWVEGGHCWRARG